MNQNTGYILTGFCVHKVQHLVMCDIMTCYGEPTLWRKGVISGRDICQCEA